MYKRYLYHARLVLTYSLNPDPVLKEESSLVSTLPHSGTQTLKLCRRGNPGIFSHVRSTKGRKEVERP